MRTRTIGLALAGVTAISGAVAATGALSSQTTRTDTSAVSSGTGGTAAGGSKVADVGQGGVAVIGDGNTLAPAPDETDEQYAARVRGSQQPTGPGPWQFVVAGDDGLGLKVRTSPEAAGVQIGYASTHIPVWVDCATVSGFVPEPGNPAGARWYRVHWPTTQPNARENVSQPADPAVGWAYSAYLVPVGTDGDVRPCP